MATSETLTAADRRPARDIRIEDSVRSSQMWELLMQGSFGYAGDDVNPRPLPQRTLFTICREYEAWTSARLKRRLREHPDDSPPWAWDTLFWVFCHERHQLPAGQAVPVPRAHLWWLASRGDTVLLSDKLTHHFSGIDRIDAEAGRIYFLDDWPERIFLREGHNAANVAAVVEPYLSGALAAKHDGFSNKLQVSISFDEFLRVAVGLVTQDTPMLAQQYLERFPAMRTRIDTRYGMGAMLMEPERDALTPHAVQHFAAAARAATTGGNDAQRLRCDAAYFHALQMARHYQRQCGDALAAKPFDDALRALLNSGDDAAWLDSLDAQSLARVGNAAMHGGELDEALLFLNRAVASDPGQEGSRHLRAMARGRAGRWVDALDDIGAALAANQLRIDARRAQRDARDERDHAGIENDEGRLRGLETRRREIQAFEIDCHVNLKAWGAAIEKAAVLAGDAGKPDVLSAVRAMAQQDGHGGSP